MTSILSELKGHRPDSVATLARLYSKSSNPIVGTKLQNDILTNVEQLISSLGSKGNGRGTTCRLLASIVTSLHKSPEIEGRLYSIIDRLAALLESVATSSEESEGFLLLLDALITNGTEEMLTRLNKVLVKLTACACRLCEKESSLLYGLNILSIFGESRSRMLLNPSASSIRKACLHAIDHPIFYSAAAHVLALQNSTETPENWMINWCNISAECVRVVQLLGIKVNIDKVTMAKVLPMIPSNSKILKLHGMRKVLAIERALRGCCTTLKEMLLNGCSSGPVAVELTYLLPLISCILTLNVDLQDNDAKNSVENESGVSPADLKAVVTQIKIHCVGVLTSLLQTQTQSVLTVCSALCRPLTSILAGKDFQSSLELSSECLRCLSAAIKCFPTSIVRDAKSGILALIDLFQCEVKNLTAVRSSVLTAGDSEENVSSLSTQPSSVFVTVEVLLLFSGPVMSAIMREDIEISVGQALSVLCKGVISPQRPDRRMHRMVCEKIRENPVLQGLMLRVAYAEVFSSQKDGMMSGNVCLLKRVCEILSKQNSTDNNSVEAVRVLLAVETLMHPSSVSLPSIPSIVAAKNYLTNSSASASSLAFNSSNLVNLSASNNTETTEITVLATESSDRVKRGREEDEEENDEIVDTIVDKKRGKGDELKSFVVDSKISAAFSANKTEKKKEAEIEDDDDDDSLPDIDIDADPEK